MAPTGKRLKEFKINPKIVVCFLDIVFDLQVFWAAKSIFEVSFWFPPLKVQLEGAESPSLVFLTRKLSICRFSRSLNLFLGLFFSSEPMECHRRWLNL